MREIHHSMGKNGAYARSLLSGEKPPLCGSPLRHVSMSCTSQVEDDACMMDGINEQIRKAGWPAESPRPPMRKSHEDKQRARSVRELKHE